MPLGQEADGSEMRLGGRDGHQAVEAEQGPATILQGLDGVDQALEAAGFGEFGRGDLQDDTAIEAVVVQELEEVPPGDRAVDSGWWSSPPKTSWQWTWRMCGSRASGG